MALVVWCTRSLELAAAAVAVLLLAVAVAAAAVLLLVVGVAAAAVLSWAEAVEVGACNLLFFLLTLLYQTQFHYLKKKQHLKHQSFAHQTHICSLRDSNPLPIILYVGA